MADVTTWWLENALLADGFKSGVRVEVTDGRISALHPGDSDGARVLRGVVIPGFANAHSHAFHRALRSRTQADRGSFWTWRDLMYRAANRLTPESYYRLAVGVFGEMALAGMTCVGEFHYVHHRPDGEPYDDPNAMGIALIKAAEAAGIRITLLDTCYLTATVGGDPLTSQQRRFSDGTVDQWCARVAHIPHSSHARIGGAIHSVRAVPAPDMAVIARWCEANNTVLHVHSSEQVGEIEQCREVHGCTPTELLQRKGVLTAQTTSVHATHLTENDVQLIAQSGSHVCFCPTTERDLGDGIGPAPELLAHHVRMSLGSDSHAVVDFFEESRAVELNERLRSRKRGVIDAGSLLNAATVDGHRSLGWGDAGRIAVGCRADFVALSFEGVRMAGATVSRESIVFGASACDVTDVVVDGRVVVADGEHVSVDVGSVLATEIECLMEG